MRVETVDEGDDLSTDDIKVLLSAHGHGSQDDAEEGCRGGGRESMIAREGFDQVGDSADKVVERRVEVRVAGRLGHQFVQGDALIA